MLHDHAFFDADLNSSSPYVFLLCLYLLSTIIFFHSRARLAASVLGVFSLILLLS
ncbi:hypothetical protein K469DRAFT_131814 [Zopfia rhizophila CBS 207.26]|uniref:Uncharacterized protein n=1 Tax=Zopfia rhizophila CBS 207.26 TaxID=1314779 RepID=A0A6A6ESY6_9PEZI|nr:hypothetical protein K469DRAFT_131814 [Zopfia rhizophila CBS 207.26]